MRFSISRAFDETFGLIRERWKGLTLVAALGAAASVGLVGLNLWHFVGYGELPIWHGRRA